jgi:hypothetical protein
MATSFGFTFSEVRDALSDEMTEGERARWDVVSRLEALFWQRLEKRGLVDVGAAVLKGIENRVHFPSGPVLLLGIVDSQPLMRKILAHYSGNVEALVHAPEEWADRFDEYGFLNTAAWGSAPIDLDLDRVHVAEGPKEQSEAVWGILAQWGQTCGPIDTHEVVLGVPDAEVVPFLEWDADEQGVPVRNASGSRLSRARPAKFLTAVLQLLERRDYQALVELLRFPELEAAILDGPRFADQDVENWIDPLDRKQLDRILRKISPRWFAGQNPENGYEGKLQETLCAVLGDLIVEGATHDLAGWAREIARGLGSVFGGHSEDPQTGEGHLAIEACRVYQEILEELSQARDENSLGAAEALHIVQELAGEKRIAPLGDSSSIELLGWLELPFEEAPYLILTGMNEGRVPTGSRVDWLFSERVKDRLSLPGEKERIARDRYALLSILKTRGRTTHIVLGIRNAGGEPMHPSRLLLACPEEQLPDRVRYLFDEGSQRPLPAVLKRPVVAGPESRFLPFPRTPVEPIVSLPVTSFRVYLEDPYTFYLRYVLRLQEREEPIYEMDPSRFGSLLHDVLQSFGQSGLTASESVEEVAQFCREELRRIGRNRFGPNPPVAVAVQVEMALLRFDRFARWQVERARAGWEVVEIEWQPGSGGVDFDVDSSPMRITGKIDRIDRHPDGRVAILDYKTGEKVLPPRRTHQVRGEWTDLQLPLYRHLVRELRLGDSVELAYVSLSAGQECELLSAGWSPQELADADAVASDVIRGIRQGEFLSPQEVLK